MSGVSFDCMNAFAIFPDMPEFSTKITFPLPALLPAGLEPAPAVHYSLRIVRNGRDRSLRLLPYHSSIHCFFNPFHNNPVIVFQP